jgi:very-short-patch-repair endonuclease
MRYRLAQERAIKLRRNSTDAERKLWRHLRRRQLEGSRFRRQVPIGPYIADFACLETGFIVEVDGAQHLHSKKDLTRDAYLRDCGFRILRFWDNDVLLNTQDVVSAIYNEIRRLPPSQPSPAERGKGTHF